MTTLMESKGRETLTDGTRGTYGMAADHREWLDAQPTVTRCALCRRVHRGTAAEGREWAQAHREERHPEAGRAGRRRLTPDQQRERAMLASDWRRRKHSGEEG